MRPSGWAVSQSDWWPYHKKKMGQTQVKRGRTPWEQKEEIAIYKSRRRSLEQHPLHKPPRKPTLLTPWFRASSLQNCETIHFCWSKPTNLWKCLLVLKPDLGQNRKPPCPGVAGRPLVPCTAPDGVCKRQDPPCVHTTEVSLMQLPHVGEWCCRSAQLNTLFNTLCLQRDLFQWVILNMCSLNILMSLLSPSLVDFVFHGTGSKTQEWCGPRQIIKAQKNRKHGLRNSMPDSAINSQDGAKC